METFARTYHLTRLWKFRDIGDCLEISLTVLRDDTHRENNKTVAKQSTIVTINNAMRRGGRGYFQQLSAVDALSQSVNSTLNVERAGLARICDTIFVLRKSIWCRLEKVRLSVEISVETLIRGFTLSSGGIEFFYRICSHSFYSDTCASRKT